MKKNRGLTLVEILVVIMIIMVIVAISWVVIAPAVRKSTFEVRIKSDLKQLHKGLLIYMADNNDKYPYMMTSLPDSLPKTMKGCVPMQSDGSFLKGGSCDYILTYTTYARRVEKYFNPPNKFDPSRDQIFYAPFRRKIRKGDVEMRIRPGEYTVVKDSFIDSHLGISMDGGIIWRDYPQKWQQEMAYYGPQLPRGSRE